MLLMTVSASAQIEILYHSTDGTSILTFTAMDRTKKLFWLDDDDNTCFTINNYKKSGNTETFTLEAKEKGSRMDRSQVTTTLDANGHTATIHYKNPAFFEGKKYKVRTNNPEDPRYHNHLVRYFNELAGNPVGQGVGDNTIDKVKGTAKEAVGKVKGLFKKK